MRLILFILPVCASLSACGPKDYTNSTRSVSPEKMDRMLQKMQSKADAATARADRRSERLQRRIDREMMQTD